MATQTRRDAMSSGRTSRRVPDKTVEELWDVPSFDRKIPPNPSYENHEPEYTKVRDVRGAELIIVEARIAKFPKMTSAVRIGEVVKIRKPLPVAGLWTGARHHRLTHALRVLQVNSVKDCNAPQDGMCRLRPGIDAEDLLVGIGAQSRSVASDLLQVLRDRKLLVTRRNGDIYCCWVNVNVRGIGPNRELYDKNDLVNGWVLPEFEPRTGEAEEEAEPTEAQTPDDPSQIDSRLDVLRSFYEAACSYVPSDAQVEDGYAVFTTPGPMTELAVKKLGITKSQAALASQSLLTLGLYKSVMVGAGRWVRHIKLGVEISSEHVEELRRIARNQHAEKVIRTKAKPKGRMAHLTTAYEIIVGEVPEGMEPGADGFVEFEANYSFSKLLSDRIEAVSENQGQVLLQDLRSLGLVVTIKGAGSRGWIKKRRVKIGHKISAEDIQKVRVLRSGRAVQQPTAAPEISESGEDAEGILAILGERLDSYQARNEELAARVAQQEQLLLDKDELLRERDATIQQLQAELEASSRTQIKFGNLPESIRRHLEQDAR